MKIIIFLTIISSFLFPFINSVKKNNIKGKEAFQEKKYDIALEHFNHSFEKNPSNPKLSYNLGNTHFFKNEYDKAISFFNKALSQIKINDFNQKEELYFNLHFSLGNSYFYKKKIKEAITHYKKALKINHENNSLKKNLELAIKELKKEKQDQQKNLDQQSSQEKDSNNSDDKNSGNSIEGDQEKKQFPEKQNSPNSKQKAIDQKTAEAILKAFETRHRDALIKKRYQEKSSNSPKDKNW